MEIHIVHKYLNTRHKLTLRNLYRSGYKKWYLSRFWFRKIAIKRVLLLREFEKISFLWLVWFFNSFDWRECNKRFGKNQGRTNFYLLCISKLQFTSVLGSQDQPQCRTNAFILLWQGPNAVIVICILEKPLKANRLKLLIADLSRFNQQALPHCNLWELVCVQP